MPHLILESLDRPESGLLTPKAKRALAIFLTLAGFSLAHNLLSASLIHWQFLLQRLYYLPIIMAALFLGWRGGLIAALFAGSSLLLRPFMDSRGAYYDLLDQCLEATIFCVVGLVIGVLSDRRDKQTSALELTTIKLGKVYRELQENFERMKRAERLYALGQLSAGLAHEIRNPLAGIEGSVTVLQSEPQSEERRREFLEIIQKECRRLNRLLTNFLDFAKPRPPQIQPADVAALLDSTISLAEHAVERKPIVLRKDLAAKIPAVECDVEQIKQVLLNLTMNAIQAMPDGGEVVLSASEREGFLHIQVADQGSGIDPRDRDRIFDPFFTTRNEGTGLGLSVAHQIVGEHGGILSVEPREGRGSTFVVILPVRHESRLGSTL
ncbi:MAG TPA: ATP-binding protein [Bryobacteraceae bacterium]|nr:ATP-binding protein [Bryobacteraceae bacterium]